MTEHDQPLVRVVDDDEALRDSLTWLLESAGHRVASYESAEVFLATDVPQQGGCLMLDIRMPGMSGLELQDELIRRGQQIPVIFITGHGDVPMAVKAVKKGALEFIEKPFNDQSLFELVEHALAIDARTRGVVARFGRLTSRERDVMALIVAGKRNQDIAEELAISIKTVEAHRSKVMWKMGVESLAALVQLVESSSAMGGLLRQSP